MLTKISLWLIAVCVILGVLSAVPPELQAQEPAGTCCSIGLTCSNGAQYCCTPDSLKALPCSEADPGYCKDVCK